MSIFEPWKKKNRRKSKGKTAPYVPYRAVWLTAAFPKVPVGESQKIVLTDDLVAEMMVRAGEMLKKKDS